MKVVWSREEDIQHDMYRPYYYDRLSAGLDADGKPVAWTHRVCGSSVMRALCPAALQGRPRPRCGARARPNRPMPSRTSMSTTCGSSRRAFRPPSGAASASTHNVFVVESFIDELAAAAKQDPVAYRKALLGHNPRALAVLTLAAEKAGWGRPLPARRGRGVSVQFAFGSYLAQVAEVEVAADGSVKVHRIVCAVDCGMVGQSGHDRGPDARAERSSA